MKKILVALSSSLALIALASPALAGNPGNPTGEKFDREHPRRGEVNQRVKNQRARINEGEKNGTLSKGQAAALHKDDHQVRQEERDMASQNGGHITKAEQGVLNHQ